MSIQKRSDELAKISKNLMLERVKFIVFTL